MLFEIFKTFYFISVLKNLVALTEFLAFLKRSKVLLITKKSTVFK